MAGRFIGCGRGRGLRMPLALLSAVAVAALTLLPAGARAAAVGGATPSATPFTFNRAAAISSSHPCGTTYGAVIVAAASWAGQLPPNTGHDGATYDVKSNYKSNRTPSPCAGYICCGDTSDTWDTEYQCTELAIRVADGELAIGGRSTWTSAGWNGSADDMLNHHPSALQAVDNGAGSLPMPGDLMVWSSSGGGDPGHVAVVSSVGGGAVTFVGENQNDGMVSLPYSGSTVENDGWKGGSSSIIGWLQPVLPHVDSGGIAMRSNGSGYALDGYGGIHPFGGAPAVSTTAYWSGWDIARGIVLRSDGVSGYVLDGWGGVHPFGGAPAVSITGYWKGWDIARGIVLRTDTSGYVLDGWGGIHPFGGAPTVSITGYWKGWDIARGIALDSDGNGGQVLDGFGGLHPFGNAPTLSGAPYWKGFDIARGITLIPGGYGGYELDGWGGVHPFGTAPGISSSGVPYHPYFDTARAIAVVECAQDELCGGVLTEVPTDSGLAVGAAGFTAYLNPCGAMRQSPGC